MVNVFSSCFVVLQFCGAAKSGLAIMRALYSEEAGMSEFSTILYNVTNQVARITLNRVDVRNAQDKTMLYDMRFLLRTFT